MTDLAAWQDIAVHLGPARRLWEWVTALPHPPLVLEIAETHVAAARWDSRGQRLEAHGIEPLPAGALSPSPVETNIVNAEAVQTAVSVVLKRASAGAEETALLVPDPVIRVFILPFDTFPHRSDEASSLLRWRLKKSVPFDVEETVVSSMRQSGKSGGLEVVAALARRRVLREYEGLAEANGLVPGVALSSALSTLPLLDEQGATLLVRLSGRNLTTVIVNASVLCVYRSGHTPSSAPEFPLAPLLDEVFPGVAYYQDTWGANVDRIRLAGFGERETEMRGLLEREMNCPVYSLSDPHAGSKLPAQAGDLLGQNLEGLVGWALERGA